MRFGRNPATNDCRPDHGLDRLVGRDGFPVEFCGPVLFYSV